MEPGVWERVAGSKLYLDQTDKPLEVDRTQVDEFYHPLATDLLARCSSGSRLVVAVAGPPGCGKTAFATILVAVINAEVNENVAVFVGLDGWHFPNEYLATHFIDRGNERMALRRLKGAPETFDATAAYEGLSQMRRGGLVTFPVYSRRLHEPVREGGIVSASHKIVVVEGNYLLLDDGAWRPFRELFDLNIFISASLETLMASLAERHERGGKTPETIKRHMREVDLPNVRQVMPSAAHAQVLVHKADARNIERIEWVTNSGERGSRTDCIH
jgi:pantothenate kinase